MRRHFIFAVAAALALAGCGKGRTNQQGATASGGDTAGTPVTIIGCLVPGGSGTSAAAVGTSGNTEATGFTLIDTTTTSTAASDMAGGSAASGTTGSSPTPAAKGGTASVDTGTPRTYNLIGAKQDELQKYANMRVEVRGAVVATTDTGLGVPDAGAASAPAGTPPTAVQRVRVDHVRKLDATCSSGSHR